MTAPYRGLDADTILTPFAERIAEAGFTFVARYLKNLQEAEVQALTSAGIKIVAIWETTSTRAEEGSEAGAEDAAEAQNLMSSLGAPEGALVMFTVDEDVEPETVKPYLDAIEAYAKANPGGPTPGLYASGAVQAVEGEMKGRWLAGAMGWTGSRTYEEATMVQGPTFLHGGEWHGMEWPDLGFPYDPDLALVEDYGGWNPVQVVGQ